MKTTAAQIKVTQYGSITRKATYSDEYAFLADVISENNGAITIGFNGLFGYRIVEIKA